LIKRTPDNCNGRNEDDNDEEIFSSRKHLMDYVTEEGIIKRTGYTNKKDWYILVLKELIDNAIDWLWQYYQGRDDSEITIQVSFDDKIFNCKVRNTNPENVPVFKDKNLFNIFDYEKTYGSKQNEFKISRGTLGDAMKYIAALPYVLTNLGRDKSNDFEDQQWKIPMYIRHNGVEQKLLLIVDEANNTIDADITPAIDATSIKHTDTEIEVIYPMIDMVLKEGWLPDGSYSSRGLELADIKNYCLDHIAGTTDISFEIKLIDNFRNKIDHVKQPRSHAIADDWSNLPSILAYTPQEFRKKIFGVDDKSTTTIYQVLRTFKEGTQIKKTPDLDVSISKFVKDAEKVKALYLMLKTSRLAKSPPRKISLPYSKVTNAVAATVAGVEEEEKGG
jgi:hypothetical protein